MSEVENLRAALRRIIERCELFIDDETDMRTSSVEVLMCIAEDALCQPAEPQGEQVPAVDELIVYRAVNQFGSECHFGVESMARIWAGPKGSVERVTLKPAPELSVVDNSAAQAEQHPPVAWLYEHDGCLSEPIATTVRWAECSEPWSESPLYAAPIAQTAPGPLCDGHGYREAGTQPDPSELIEALQQIERWDGFPGTGKTWPESGEPMSYGACFGRNGERNFMRLLAAKAVERYRASQATRPT